VEMFGHDWAQGIFRAQDAFSVYFTGTFVLLGGVTVRFSRNPALRGARLFFLASAFTFFTALIFPGSAIYSGVLHLFCIGMLLYAVAGKAIERIPAWVGLPLAAVLFIFFYNTPNGWIGFGEWPHIEIPEALTWNNLLNGFGFVNRQFSSVDYLPALPWLFLFISGVYVGKLLDRNLPEFFYRDWCPPVTWLGKHSLIIYVLHQPVIFVLLSVLHMIIR